MPDYDIQAIKANNPLDVYLGKAGHPLKALRNGELVTNCPLHEDRSPSFSVNLGKGLWTCRAGCGGGDIITLVEKMENVSRGEAIKRLSADQCENYAQKPRPAVMPLPEDKNESTGNVEQKKAPSTLVATYDYRDETGRLRYQVLRYEPKTFRQRKADDHGNFEWSMDGVERVPYNLPKVLESSMVAIVEGEKDADNLVELGMTATCNAGGAKKWLPSYSRYFKDKRVYIIPDNDEPGQEHARQVLKSLEGRVKWVKWMELPKLWNDKPIKDISDFIAACKDKKDAIEQLALLEKKARLISRGVDCEIYSVDELIHQYQQEVLDGNSACLDLKLWLPSLQVRPLVRGDLLAIMGGTGNLKTATTQNILQRNGHLNQLFFELELANRLFLERSLAMATRNSAEQVEQMLVTGKVPDWKRTNRINNLYVCLKSNVSMEYVEEQIERASAKIGAPVDVFVIDYIQLIRGAGSRYERVSDAAEQAKVLAKKYNCVGIILSQIGRKKMDDKHRGEAEQPPLEVTLQDGKESGSIENSCGLILGVWKDGKNTMQCRVLKNTKGLSGQTVPMEIAGASLIIEERSNTPKVIA